MCIANLITTFSFCRYCCPCCFYIDEVKDLKKKQGHETRDIAKIDEQCKEIEIKIAKKKPVFIKVYIYMLQSIMIVVSICK